MGRELFHGDPATTVHTIIVDAQIVSWVAMTHGDPIPTLERTTGESEIEHGSAKQRAGTMPLRAVFPRTRGV